MEKSNGQGESQRIKKVVFIGPESTGKSTLSALVARYYQTEWVPEYARNYIERLSRPYKEGDLLKIAKGQVRSENQKARKAKQVLICDTDLHVIKVWAKHKYGRCHPSILQEITKRKYDLYLLCYIDLPWVADNQREHPHQRDYFYEIYQKELAATNVPVVEIRGEYYERLNTAINAINNILPPRPYFATTL